MPLKISCCILKRFYVGIAEFCFYSWHLYCPLYNLQIQIKDHFGKQWHYKAKLSKTSKQLCEIFCKIQAGIKSITESKFLRRQTLYLVCMVAHNIHLILRENCGFCLHSWVILSDFWRIYSYFLLWDCVISREHSVFIFLILLHFAGFYKCDIWRQQQSFGNIGGTFS